MTSTPLADHLDFPRCAHLRASAEFQAVFGEGKRISGACFRLHARIVADASERRLGVAVSKRVDKAAVGRNRVRRQVKEVFRLHRAHLPGGDFVFVAKPEAAKADNAALRADLLSLLDRARTLKPMTPPGTMPPSAATTGRDPTAP
ncbi:MAG TPA: ribonuclease P protein component [Arenimonas sp.]|uniref:ribonuclease P protein component n=1 Tax=Arenimonas sp. TaxID=1872635 RepID=UPI002BB13B78|nr:ribonuclease P protein component [Arenimonas sp.]HMB58081.1 ribonuclease P protein component [Arenimonas sp.]